MDAPQWPRGGEIDLMEWVQGTPNDIYQTVHTYFINGDNGSAGATNPNRPTNFDITQYHVYAADRTEEAIIFYIDGKKHGDILISIYQKKKCNIHFANTNTILF